MKDQTLYNYKNVTTGEIKSYDEWEQDCIDNDFDTYDLWSAIGDTLIEVPDDASLDVFTREKDSSDTWSYCATLCNYGDASLFCEAFNSAFNNMECMIKESKSDYIGEFHS